MGLLFNGLCDKSRKKSIHCSVMDDACGPQEGYEIL